MDLSYREAIAKGIREALTEDENSFIMGEDIGPYGGAYAVTKGLTDEFGSRRIKDSPLSEEALIGAGIGAALIGLRPIVEIMTINFTLLGIDQIVNHAAKLRYMSGGQLSVPLLIRTVTGGGMNLGATHSQSLESWYARVPGLNVVVPSTPYDALGLFRTCRTQMDTTIFVEHGLLYGSRGPVPEERYEIPLGTADVKRAGKDITLVAYSRMVNVALSASLMLEKEGIDAEVIDLRSLRPLDSETILVSTRKTHRAVVIEETWKTGGFAGEIASQIHENAFDYLDAPVGRVGGEDVPSPYSPALEPLAIPDANRIVEAVHSVMGR